MSIVLWTCAILGFLLVSMGVVAARALRVSFAGAASVDDEATKYCHIYGSVAAFIGMVLGLLISRGSSLHLEWPVWALTFAALFFSLMCSSRAYLGLESKLMNSVAGTGLLSAWGMLAWTALHCGIATY